MSVCDGCGHDDIWGGWRDRRDRDRRDHHLMWLCGVCRRSLLHLPVPMQESRRWTLIPSVSIVSLAAVLISVILALGAHL